MKTINVKPGPREPKPSGLGQVAKIAGTKPEKGKDTPGYHGKK